MPIAVFCHLEEGPCFRMVEYSNVRIAPAALGAKPLQGLELPLELVLFPEIIRVQKSDPFSPRFRDSLVPGHTGALIGLGVVADSITESLPKDLPRVIGRSVIHHNDFEVGDRLGKDAFDAFPHGGCPVIRRNNDGYLEIHKARTPTAS